MIAAQFTDNLDHKVLPLLRTSIGDAVDARMAVAFLKKSGLDLIEESLVAARSRGAAVEMIVRLDFQITEARALRRLMELGLPFYCYVSRPTDDMPSYHPKLYIFAGAEHAQVIVGSSNLTSGGLRDNIEVNINLTLSLGEELLSDIYGVYNQIKFLRGCRVPDEDFVEQYRETAQEVRRAESRGRTRKAVREAVSRLRERERQLPRPTVAAIELFGWQRLVFDVLPEGPFRLRDLYRLGPEFRGHYPENQHINDKVRQILQQLRDLGLVSNPARGAWSKST